MIRTINIKGRLLQRTANGLGYGRKIMAGAFYIGDPS